MNKPKNEIAHKKIKKWNEKFAKYLCKSSLRKHHRIILNNIVTAETAGI